MFYPQTYTVESVTAGHPDKVCDQMSDAILDECLKQDPDTRAGIECFGSHGTLVIGGEVTTQADISYEKIARQVYQDIGYTNPLRVILTVAQQSPDIAQGVDTGGAGDQGIMYGYATNETKSYMPHGVELVHKLTKGLENLRTSGKHPWLGPDGKAQITIVNDQLKTILVSTQHVENITQEEIKETLKKDLIEPEMGNSTIEVLINPTGKFVKGGFEADAGLTGRKIMVDTYGGLITHGGGCFSGKDPTKVDRSGAYMARFVAKNIVANGLTDECLVTVAYAIGKAEPVMVEIMNAQGNRLSNTFKEKFDFRPQAIIERLNLKQPIYQQTAAYGHFGKDGLPWEEIITV